MLLLGAYLCATACGTARQKDDTVMVVVDTSPPPVVEGDAPRENDEPQVDASAPSPEPAAETLPPVRGGARVLPPYRGPEPCRMALLGESPVAQACSARGVRGALDLMQAFVKRAKAEGIVFACVDCHVDEDDYTNLRPRADAEFRKLLFLARPED